MHYSLYGPVDFQAFIREFPGKNRCDISRLLVDGDVFQHLIQELAKPFEDDHVTHVAALDANGFLLGSAVAFVLGAGVVQIRKVNKIPCPVRTASFTDYTGQQKTFEIAEDALTSGDRVLVVDDWSETGTQLRAAVRLIEDSGADVIGVAAINIDDCARQNRELSRFRLHSIVRY